MERSEIIRKLLSEGYQIDPGALDVLVGSPDLIKSVLSRLSGMNRKPTTITEKFVSESAGALEEKLKITILQDYRPTKKEFTVDEYVSYYNDRYSRLKEILEAKQPAGLVSVNKIRPSSMEFSIIVMIREIDDEIEVEDSTGSLKVELMEDLRGVKLLKGDVVCLFCRREEWRIMIEDVWWPDVSLRRGVRKSANEINLVFTKESELLESTNYIKNQPHNNKIVIALVDDGRISIRDIGDMKSVNSFDSPVMISVGGVVILFLSDSVLEKYDGSSAQTAIDLLKRRNINPVQDIPFGERDPFVLDEAPDIVVFSSADDGSSIANYKGTTIISIGATPIGIDLSTREATKIK